MNSKMEDFLRKFRFINQSYAMKDFIKEFNFCILFMLEPLKIII